MGCNEKERLVTWVSLFFTSYSLCGKASIMATTVKYTCPKCGSTVSFSANVEGQIKFQKSVPCPKLGCSGQAKIDWSKN